MNPKKKKNYFSKKKLLWIQATMPTKQTKVISPRDYFFFFKKEDYSTKHKSIIKEIDLFASGMGASGWTANMIPFTSMLFTTVLCPTCISIPAIFSCRCFWWEKLLEIHTNKNKNQKGQLNLHTASSFIQQLNFCSA